MHAVFRPSVADSLSVCHGRNYYGYT